jgi:hypothetical protein
MPSTGCRPPMPSSIVAHILLVEHLLELKEGNGAPLELIFLDQYLYLCVEPKEGNESKKMHLLLR